MLPSRRFVSLASAIVLPWTAPAGGHRWSGSAGCTGRRKQWMVLPCTGCRVWQTAVQQHTLSSSIPRVGGCVKLLSSSSLYDVGAIRPSTTSPLRCPSTQANETVPHLQIVHCSLLAAVDNLKARISMLLLYATSCNHYACAGHRPIACVTEVTHIHACPKND